MKVFSLCAFVLLLICDPSFGQDANPLVGAWELIYGKYSVPGEPSVTERNQPDRPFQLKVFSPGHFAYVMQDEGGAFSGASAGSYRIEGDLYIETHDWQPDPKYVGATSTYRFRIEGDTLYMSGPVKSVYANGQEIADHPQMEEIRIRAK